MQFIGNHVTVSSAKFIKISIAIWSIYYQIIAIASKLIMVEEH